MPRNIKKQVSETSHQISVIQWTQQPEIRSKWPELKLLHHIPNERICTPQQGKTLKMMGLRRGVPDLCLPVARGPYHGLYIEMKAEHGKTSIEQDWWGEQLTAQGYLYTVCKGNQAAILALKRYMSMEVPSHV